MKHPIDFSTIVIIIILVVFARVSYTSLQCCGKFEEVVEAEENKVLFLKSDKRNGHIARRFFEEVKKDVIYAEDTVIKIIHAADKFLSNEIVDNLITLTLAIASLNPAIEIPIDMVKLIVMITREVRWGVKKFTPEYRHQLKESFVNFVKASVTFPKKFKEKSVHDEKVRLDEKAKNIVQISQSGSNGEIAAKLCKYGPFWVQSEVENVIRVADKVYSQPVQADVIQLGKDLTALKDSDEVEADFVAEATAALEQINKAISENKRPDHKCLEALKENIKRIAKCNAEANETELRGSHFWDKAKRKLERKKEKIIYLANVGKSDKSELCRLLLEELKLELISVESEVKYLIIRIGKFLDHPASKYLLKLGLKIALMNPYVGMSVASFRLVMVLIREIRKIHEERERDQQQPYLAGKLKEFRKKVIAAVRQYWDEIRNDGSPGRTVRKAVKRSLSTPSCDAAGRPGVPYKAYTPSDAKQSHHVAPLQKMDSRSCSMILGNKGKSNFVEHSQSTTAQQQSSTGVSPMRRANASPTQTDNAPRGSTSGGQPQPQDRSHPLNRAQGISAQRRLDNQPH